MKSLLAALSFLTRLPAGRWMQFSVTDVADSAGLFPVAGLLLGLIYWGAAAILKGHLPMAVVAILLVALDAILTGAMHFDGLADTADGFGGGKDENDVLRIMRDHSIGSYGGVALVLAIVMKTALYTFLLEREYWFFKVALVPVLGRWSILLLAAALPYARHTASVIEGMSKVSLVWGTLTVVLAIASSGLGRAWVAAAVVVAVSALFGLYCRRRIGGVTGDTLGANLQLCEVAALLTFVWA